MDCGISSKAKWACFHLSGVSELFPKVKKISPLFLFIFVVNLFTFNLRIIVLQYCVGFCHISAWISHRSTYGLPSWTSLSRPTPSHPQVVTEHQIWAPCIIKQIFTGYLILPVVMYMLQCYSPNLSQLLLPPLGPQVGSLCMHPNCCLADRLISTILKGERERKIKKSTSSSSFLWDIPLIQQCNWQILRSNSVTGVSCIFLSFFWGYFFTPKNESIPFLNHDTYLVDSMKCVQWHIFFSPN